MANGKRSKNPSAARRLRVGATFLSAVLLAGSLATAGATATAAAPTFTAVGSVEQVYVTGLTLGAHATLVDKQGETVKTKTATELGAVLFRHVTPGGGYHVRSEGAESPPVKVRTDKAAPWDPSIYDQEIPENGYSYLTTRDGTKLAVSVHPPSSPAGQPGLPPGIPLPEGPDYLPPYPTLIEYSGYGYADPAGPHSGIAILANLMGFAVVDVNMRGTGCSGGAFDFFEPLQSLDGYDVIETIANQPWVRDHQVGMMGISYGGISQLFTARLQPPSLAAISPLSVLDTTATTLYPGGVLNTGFAVAWAKERQKEAQPAGPDAGQAWAYDRIQGGDETCAENQALHGEAANLDAKIAKNSHYDASVADPLDPVTFVDKINVPTFLVCQWQDEQTGGHCPELVSHFTGTNKKWFTFTNGAHIDSLDPETYNRWYDFLQLYVANQAPSINQGPTRAAAPVIYQAAMGLPEDETVTLPPDPIQEEPTYEGALEAFEALPQVRVLFDNGAGEGPTQNASPGDPYPGFEHSFSTFPIPDTAAKTWFFRSKGRLAKVPSIRAHVDHYTSDAKALPLTNYGSNTGTGGLWGNASQWDWKWEQNPSGKAVSYVSGHLKSNKTVVGAGAVYVWVRSSTPNVDLQATISEVRPDGNETFVQNGYLRASERKLSTDSDNLFKSPSTLLNPKPTFLKSDDTPMPSNKFVKIAIPLYYQGHVYRANSRIRVTIAAPNGAQPVWSFGKTKPKGTSKVAIAISAKRRSRLVLPVIPGLEVPTKRPPCPSLRNQPCRPYQAIEKQ
jgi:predicted acyl esterase